MDDRELNCYLAASYLEYCTYIPQPKEFEVKSGEYIFTEPTNYINDTLGLYSLLANNMYGPYFCIVENGIFIIGYYDPDGIYSTFQIDSWDNYSIAYAMLKAKGIYVR